MWGAHDERGLDSGVHKELPERVLSHSAPRVSGAAAQRKVQLVARENPLDYHDVSSALRSLASDITDCASELD